MRIRFILNVATTFIFTSPVFAQLPIKPTRTIQITTDKGSNMDVDVSPDGKTIVFDLLGDLFTVPVTGGKATQITRGMALNSSPTWSPDGKRIAYVSDYSGAFHLNVMDIADSLHWLLGNSDDPLELDQKPVWSPDGNYIAVSTSIYGLAGGRMALPDGVIDPLQFPSDHPYLYCFSRSLASRYDYLSKSSERVFSIGRKCENSALSPNERWLAFVADSNKRKCLLVMDLRDHSERMLVGSLLVENPHQLGWSQPRFSFSADSRYIYIGFGGKIHRIDVGTGQDLVIPFLATIKADLGPFDYNTFPVKQDFAKARYTRWANARPDGKQLVFSALNKLYVMSLPNGNPHVLINQSVSQYQPVYSPDGRWIAYVSWCDSVGGFLWRVPSSGGTPEKLSSTAALYEQPAWSPDGAHIAIIRARPDLGRRDSYLFGKLEILSVADGSVRDIDDSVPLMNRLTFTDDGKRIVYEPPLGHGTGRKDSLPFLISRDMDGRNEEVVMRGGKQKRDGVGQSRTISPDGRFAVYSMQEDLYLVPLFRSPAPLMVDDLKQKTNVIRFAAGRDPFWEKGGKGLSWSYGNRFYRIDPDKVVAAAQRKAAGKPIGEDLIEAAISPDEVIELKASAPFAAAHGTIALRNARILTMRNSIIDHGTIVIRDGRLISVGSNEKVFIPAGATVIDLAGKTIMPGIVDMHLHMELPGDIFPQQSWALLINLAYGVTTARDPYTVPDAFGYTDLLETGEMLGPRLYNTGRAVIGDYEYEGAAKIDSLNDAKAIVHKRALMGSIVIKQYWLFERRQREWLLMASKEAGLNMTNEGYFDPLLILGQIKDGSTGIEHMGAWGDVYKDVLSFVAQSKTYLTPTLVARSSGHLFRELSNHIYWGEPDAKLQRFTPKRRLERFKNQHLLDTTEAGFMDYAKLIGRTQKLGGRVLMGSHGDDEGVGVHNEIWALQSGGLTNMEALQAATIRAAEGLGVQRDLGSIEVGKIADLVILNKNPLDDIHNSREILYVMKNGFLYEGDTLDQIWPEKKKCPEWWMPIR